VVIDNTTVEGRVQCDPTGLWNLDFGRATLLVGFESDDEVTTIVDESCVDNIEHRRHREDITLARNWASKVSRDEVSARYTNACTALRTLSGVCNARYIEPIAIWVEVSARLRH
tara:strand:- start:16 stop:357 length:342 start_codon:yes stop_codon:yes gene_type:complete